MVAADLGTALATAIANRDEQTLLGLFTPDVDFRGLTPGGFWEASTSDELVREILFTHWFKAADELRGVERLDEDSIGSRRKVTWRIAGTNATGPFLVEQTAYFEVDGDRISWIRVHCSGQILAEV